MRKNVGFSRLLHDFDLRLASVFLVLLIAITVAGVFFRYYLNRPLTWLEEVQLACFIWVAFLGACAVARKTGHIAIDAFVGIFPMFLRKVAKTVTHLVIIAAIGFLGYYSLLFVNQMYTSGRSTNILLIPNWLIYAVVPAACLYMAVNSFLVLAGARDPRPVEYRKEDPDHV
ncbi:MAG: TRAP transporter small permease [Planctomycetota bacterium]|nr:TRAP transporter small permease [Planctomycetota bacterium]